MGECIIYFCDLCGARRNHATVNLSAESNEITKTIEVCDTCLKEIEKKIKELSTGDLFTSNVRCESIITKREFFPDLIDDGDGGESDK